MLPITQDLIGREIGGYRLARVLGRGATGVVFLGERQGGERTQAALKLLILPPQLSDQERAEFQARFRREAVTLLELQHPHILSVLGFGEDSATGLSYLILPFVERTLMQRIASVGGPLPLEEVAIYATQLAEALDYAHQHGVIHRDVKPSNVLLDNDNHTYLTDFSIAHLFDLTRTTITATGQVLGTPAYMAPEQLRGEQVGPASDIYSLGTLLYQLVTGRTPFEGKSFFELVQRATTELPAPPRQLRPDLPEPASAALLRVLAKQPDRRFATALDLAHAFAKGLQGEWAGDLRSYSAFGAGERTEPDASGVVAPTSWPFPPKSQSHPRRKPKTGSNMPLTISLFSLAVAVIVAIVGGILFLPALGAPEWLAQLTSFSPSQPTPTATLLPTPTENPTPTPLLSYSATTPGPGCGSTDWSEADQPQGNVQCTSAGLLMVSPSGASANTSVFWSGAGLIPTSYSVRVTVSRLASACGGIGFQTGYRAYIGYICANGEWVVVRYDSTGSPTQLEKGFVAQQSSQLLEIIVTNDSTLQFHVGATTVFSDLIASGYNTESVTLALYGYTGQTGQGYFNNFVYSRD